MHLMSFYATPYSSRHRKEEGSSAPSKHRILWFSSGVLCGLLSMFLYSHISSLTLPTIAFTEEETVAEQTVADIMAESAPLKDNGLPSAQPKSALQATDKQKQTRETLLKSSADSHQHTSSSLPLRQNADDDNIPAALWPKYKEVTIRSGDTLIDILVRNGIDNVEAHRLAREVNKTYDLRKLRPGHKLRLTLVQDENRANSADRKGMATQLQELVIYISKLKSVVVKPLGNQKYKITISKKELKTEPKRAKGVINSSLYMTASQQGVSDRTIAKLIKNFSYDIDFQRDIRTGDVIDVMYEHKTTMDGDYSVGGEVLYAKLKAKGNEYVHYRFTNELGLPAYYDAKGESIVKKLLKTPIDGARISSRFGMRRHPVLGYSKMHKGVDFAAPTGTPIYAAGDGIVTFAGRKGGYGNIVVIKHNGSYSTAYAHAHRFARGIRKNKKVAQGQVIAYVGSTGRSTGPHLHYEIRKHGKQVNPLHVNFSGGTKLKGKKLAEFKEHVRKIHHQLASMKMLSDDQEHIALAE